MGECETLPSPLDSLLNSNTLAYQCNSLPVASLGFVTPNVGGQSVTPMMDLPTYQTVQTINYNNILSCLSWPQKSPVTAECEGGNWAWCYLRSLRRILWTLTVGLPRLFNLVRAFTFMSPVTPQSSITAYSEQHRNWQTRKSGLSSPRRVAGSLSLL